jgi:hypothetical protein
LTDLAACVPARAACRAPRFADPCYSRYADDTAGQPGAKPGEAWHSGKYFHILAAEETKKK